MSRNFILLILIVFFAACQKEKEEARQELKYEEKYVLAEAGGTLVTSDSIKLTIPAGALPTSGNVFLGRTGNEALTFPNTNLESLVAPITIRFPTGSIKKPVALELPIHLISLDTLKSIALGYNGSSYFPFDYTYNGEKILITIDVIDWEKSLNKSTSVAAEIIIYLSFDKQYPPIEQMGLKKVISDKDGNLVFMSPTIKPAAKVLLLIHGWTGNAERWDKFIPKIQNTDNLKYSEIWTFVYISAKPIKSNATLLKEALDIYAKEKQVDIVAHSMGGLVARSMIEQCDGVKYVNKLITLGTPHLGSPLAIFRMILGYVVTLDPTSLDPLLPIIYNLNTQGFRDLRVNSSFIRTLAKTGPPKIPYYTIAAINNPYDESNSKFAKQLSIIASKYLDGPDDGIVQVSSALAIDEAIRPEAPILISTAWAHMAMPDDDQVFNQVVKYLDEPNYVNYGSFIDPRDGNIYRTVQIGNQIWMAENFNFKTPSSLSYYNDELNSKKYGRLYTWNDAMEICPSGWHLPTPSDWDVLIKYLGGSAVAGGKLKEAGFEHWSSPNEGATNETGFTALPAGRYALSLIPYTHWRFVDIGKSTCFWTNPNTYMICLSYDHQRFSYVYFSTGYDDRLISVRYIKD